MNNFRQYRGKQEIVFASKYDKNDKNITIIFGENGRGKTGIFRAMMFCFYGDIKLSQDSHVAKEELNIVNTRELEKGKDISSSSPINCSVEIEFIHDNIRYNLERHVLGIYDDDEIIEELGPVKLSLKKENGNSDIIENPSEINKAINSILDKGVREYFLFDGEKIEKLTRASSEQRKEISYGLRNLLNIDSLETAKKATLILKKKLDSDLENKSKGKYRKILNKIKNCTDKRTTLENQLNDIDNDLAFSVAEKRKTDKKLEQIKSILDLLTQRNKLEEQEKELNSQLDTYLLDIKSRNSKLSSYILNDVLKECYTYIDGRKQKGEIPSEIRKDFIQSLIDSKECICGTKVYNSTDEYNNLIRWKDKAQDLIVDDFMINLWSQISGINSNFGDIVENCQSLFQSYSSTTEEMERTRLSIKKINDKIGSPVRSDASKLQSVRDKTERKIISLEADRKNILSSIENLKFEYKKLSAKRKEIEKEEGIRDELAKRATLVASTYDALSDIYDEFTADIKNLISLEATEFFRKLIDKQGLDTLDKIIVQDDYSLQILNKWGKTFLANISAGQRQIMSISFIAALAKTASKDGFFEMPFFMDSPFGRLSNEHRKNVIKSIPEFANQWVLLATDTEFRKIEAREFQKTGLWGKFYTLRGDGAAQTFIEEHSTEEAFSFLDN